MDIVFLLVGFGFFAVTGWMMRGFGKLTGE